MPARLAVAAGLLNIGSLAYRGSPGFPPAPPGDVLPRTLPAPQVQHKDISVRCCRQPHRTGKKKRGPAEPAALTVARVLAERFYAKDRADKPDVEAPEDGFSVSSEEALRFVDAIGGEWRLSKILGMPRKALEPQDKEEFFAAMRKIKDKSRSKYVMVANIEEVAEVLVDGKWKEELFEWICAPGSERELQRRAGLTADDIPVIRGLVSRAYPESFGSCFGEEFTFSLAPCSGHDDVRGDDRLAAQLEATFAAQIRDFHLYCGEMGFVGKLEVGVRRSSKGRHFVVSVLGPTLISFPELQPWFFSDETVYFYGVKSRQLKSFEEELFFKVLAWQRQFYRSSGFLPDSAAFGFDVFEDSPVVRVFRVGFNRDSSYRLETQCVGATSMEALKLYAIKVALEPLHVGAAT